MKNFVFLFVLTFVSFAACKNDSTSATDERSVPATTQTSATANSALDAKNAKDVKTTNTPAVPTGPTTSIEFDDSTFDFGEVMDGEKVQHVYKFKNTGKEPLIISNAKGSCGCTVPTWPREPIPVGGEGEIMVQFDSKNKGKVGGSPQSKRVTLTSNTDPVNTYLTIKGTVNKEEGATNPS